MDLEKDFSYFLELQTNTGWGRMLQSFAQFCQPQPGWHVLDIGCGPGLLPALFAKMGCQSLGSDLDQSMFKPTPLHPNVLAADVLALPFSLGQFDLITASNLLFLLPDPAKVLHSMAQFINSEGRIALLNPSEDMNLDSAKSVVESSGLVGVAHDSLLNYAIRAESHQRWSPAELDRIFAKAGLQLEETTTRMKPGLVRFALGVRTAC